jgi:hypothetical protein
MKNYQTNTTNNKTMIITETNDVLTLNLSSRNQVKPASVQIRILRRIMEKRQAQTNHRRKVIVPDGLEPLNWRYSLYNSQIVCNFASQTNN